MYWLVFLHSIVDLDTFPFQILSLLIKFCHFYMSVYMHTCVDICYVYILVHTHCIYNEACLLWCSFDLAVLYMRSVCTVCGMLRGQLQRRTVHTFVMCAYFI